MRAQWQHHLVEDPREHGGREEDDRSQRLGAGVDEIVTDIRRQHEDAAGFDREGAIVAAQLAGAGDDAPRFPGWAGVPAQTIAGLDFEDDGGRLIGAMAALGDEDAGPLYVGHSLATDLNACESSGIDRVEHHILHQVFKEIARSPGRETATDFQQPVIT